MDRLPERYPLSVEAKVEGFQLGGVPIRGRVDRIDAFGPDGCLIIDYKSGSSTPEIGDLKSGMAIQGLLYGEWARDQWKDRGLVASVYARVGKADDIKEKAWMGDETLLQSKRKGSKFVLSEEARSHHLKHIERALDGLKNGVRHPTLAKPAKVGCEHCAYHRICRFDEERARRLAGDEKSIGPMEVE